MPHRGCLSVRFVLTTCNYFVPYSNSSRARFLLESLQGIDFSVFREGGEAGGAGRASMSICSINIDGLLARHGLYEEPGTCEQGEDWEIRSRMCRCVVETVNHLLCCSFCNLFLEHTLSISGRLGHRGKNMTDHYRELASTCVYSTTRVFIQLHEEGAGRKYSTTV